MYLGVLHLCLKDFSSICWWIFNKKKREAYVVIRFLLRRLYPINQRQGLLGSKKLQRAWTYVKATDNTCWARVEPAVCVSQLPWLERPDLPSIWWSEQHVWHLQLLPSWPRALHRASHKQLHPQTPVQLWMTLQVLWTEDEDGRLLGCHAVQSAK
jgi:hypothetical protein